MGRKKIMVVDDDPLLAKTIYICLSKRGHDAKVFHNSTDAAGDLLEEKPDLLVLDIRLPDGDGWSPAKLLEERGYTAKVPIIVISALEPDRRKVTEVKPYAYIQKPFDMEQLMRTVERSLNSEVTDK